MQKNVAFVIVHRLLPCVYFQEYCKVKNLFQGYPRSNLLSSGPTKRYSFTGPVACKTNRGSIPSTQRTIFHEPEMRYSSATRRDYVFLASLFVATMLEGRPSAAAEESMLSEETAASLRYRKILGSGGYKTVYLIEDPSDHRTWALAVERLVLWRTRSCFSRPHLRSAPETSVMQDGIIHMIRRYPYPNLLENDAKFSACSELKKNPWHAALRYVSFLLCVNWDTLPSYACSNVPYKLNHENPCIYIQIIPAFK